MVVERAEFFAELDGLTEKEIEARLDLWDQEQLALIQEYLDQRVLTRAKAGQAAQIKAGPSAQDAVVASLVEVASEPLNSRLGHDSPMLALRGRGHFLRSETPIGVGRHEPYRELG